MKILAGTGSKVLGQNIAKISGLDILDAEISRFKDNESRVEIKEDIYNQEVAVIQTTEKDQNIIELLLILDALKRCGAKKIELITPYFGYSRADRIVQKGSAIGAKVIAKLLSDYINSLTVVDVHFGQFEGFFDVPVYNLLPDCLFADIVKASKAQSGKVCDILVAAPDIGSVKRAESFAKRLDLDLLIINKKRSKPGESAVTSVIGSPKDKHCIIIDDIVCGGGTLCNAAKSLKDLGAKSVEAFITHGVFSGDAIKNIEGSAIDKLTVADTIESQMQNQAKCKNIKVASVAELIAGHIFGKFRKVL